MIFSPQVPVIRNDEGVLLDTPFCVSMITSPAVNAGIVRERESQKIGLIDFVMKKRIEKILAVSMVHQQKALVLGAFGCEVFKNRPLLVAQYFKEILGNEKFKEQFEKIVFAIYEPKPQKTTYEIFHNVFQRPI